MSAAIRHFLQSTNAAAALVLVAGWWGWARAEQPGEFRPKAIDAPNITKVGATGLKVQPLDDLPKSRALASSPTRRSKSTTKARPELRSDDELVLNAGWELVEAPHVQSDGARLSRPGVDTSKWYDAVVPGTVMTTLVDQGVYPDPCFGLNNMSIPESLNKQDYWYRTEFRLPETMTGSNLQLTFQGINYYAEVWLNGRYLGHITGAFCRGEFDVTRVVQPDAINALAVMVAPVPNPGIPHEQSVKGGPGPNGGTMCLDGPTFFCTEGWDWIPAIRDRCTGIWQEVVLRATGPVRLGDPNIITRLPLPDTSRADVAIEVEVRNSTDRPQEGVLHAMIRAPEENGKAAFVRKVGRPLRLAPGESQTVRLEPKDFPDLRIEQPRLWWPNGYGRPDLHRLDLRFTTSDGRDSDRKTLRFGIREVSYELGLKTADGGMRRYEYRPTGVPLSDAPAIDIRRESMLALDKPYKGLSAVALAPGGEKSPALKPLPDDPMGPFLVIRVNGQRILCRGGNWGIDDALKRVSRKRLEPCIRMHRDAHVTMIRNWCGQSTEEVFYDLCDEYGILVWNDFWMSTENWNYPPADSDLMLRNVADTVKRYRTHPSIAIWCPRNEGIPPDDINEGIDRLVRQLDGARHYHPQSRNVNLRGSGPWSNQPLEKYFGQLSFGFTTELGACSIPSVEVMRSMIAPQDLWPADDVWAYHDFHSKGAGDRVSLLKRMDARFGEATDLDAMCRKAQMVNYETWRAIFESHNAKLWTPCSGVIAWMSHPCWPSVVWQFYTWDYEPNASLFAVQKACEPVHVQMNLPDCQVAVINHGPRPLEKVRVTARLCDLQGKTISEREAVLTAAANAHTEAFALDCPADQASLVRLELRDAGGKLLSDNFYWHASDETRLQALNSLPQVRLEATMHSQPIGPATVVTGQVRNMSSTPALMIRLTLRQAEDGSRVLPVYYGDNYFSLLPGESREFRIECGPREGAALRLDFDGWNVAPIQLR